jgi:hypothetical protein
VDRRKTLAEMRQSQRGQDGMATIEENEDGTEAEAEAPTGRATETIDVAALIVPKDETKETATVIAIVVIVIADTAEIAIEVEAEIGETTNVMIRKTRDET